MKNKLKRILFTIVVGLFTVTIHSQQIGNGSANLIEDFTIPLGSGTYNALNPIGALPESDWQHLFVVRHPNSNNNYQLQIASSMTTNDRLYFRKLASGAATPINPSWNELATRGANDFIGPQTINGSITSHGTNDVGGTINLTNISKTANGIAKKWSIYNMTGVYGNSLQFWAYDDKECAGGFCANRFTIMDNGNIGIGVMTPTNKLDVNGTIHSREVKVDITGWPDYVFKKEFDLPTLEEVEKHINEKGHLENIPDEKEVLKNGINLGEMNAKLLQKIEELTLYVIEQNKKINELEKENKRFSDIEKRLEKIEKVSK
jgi:hypothetical protein